MSCTNYVKQDMKHKICARCKLEHPISEFIQIKDKKGNPRYYSYCSTCHTEYIRNWRHTKAGIKSCRMADKNRKKRRFKDRILAKYGCQLCGERDVSVLEFDHIDPKTKEHNISRLVKNCRPIKEIKDEMRKCQVLCRNCHIKKSTREQKERKLA